MWMRLILCVLAGVSAYVGFNVYTAYTARQDIDTASQEYALIPAQSDLSVVEFLDYGCPHCRAIHPAIRDAVKQDGRVRYVPRVLPYINEDAARFVYAAGAQGQFMAVHESLMAQSNPLDELSFRAVAEAHNLDYEQIQVDMYAAPTEDKIRENIRLFKGMNGRATPFFVIDRDITYVPSGRMPTADDFLALFARARKQAE